jgi:hypothetical protein
MTVEQRIRMAGANLFDSLGAEVHESFLPLARTELNLRVLAHGSGAPLVLLHGVALSAAVWAPLFRSCPAGDCSRWIFLATDCRIPRSTGAAASASTRGG